MGDSARIDRSDRFIAEFKGDYAKRSKIQKGDTLKVEAFFLTMDEEDGFSTVEIFHFKTKDGAEMIASLGRVYDPDDDVEYTVEQLMEHLGIEQDEARRRLTKADLY